MNISSLLAKSEVINVPILYVQVFGSWQAAMMLTQLIAWDDTLPPESEGWQHISRKRWWDELVLDDNGLKKARKALIEAGVVEYKLKGMPAKPHYRVNGDALVKRLERP